MSGCEVTTEQFSLRWNNYHTNLKSGFHNLFIESEMIDVTLAVDGHFLRAHKIVLSICSPYFKEMFKMNPCDHPIVILKDIDYDNMKNILQFMYMGEVSILSENLSSFLKTAEALQIKGLTGDDSNEEPTSTKADKSDSETTDGDDKDEIYNQLIETTTTTGQNVDMSPPTVQYQTNLPPQTSPLPLRTSTSLSAMKRSSNSFSCPTTAASTSANTNKKLKYTDCFPKYSDSLKKENDNSLPSASNCSVNTSKSDVKIEIKDDEETAKDYTKNDGGSGGDGDNDGNSNLWETNSVNVSAIAANSGCDNNFTDQGDGKGHVNCPLCCRRFVNRYNLKVHVRDKHNSNSTDLDCQICGKTMRNQSCLRVHLYHHRKQQML